MTTAAEDPARGFRLYRPALAPPAEPVRPLDGIDWRGGLVVRAVNWLGDTFMALPAVYQVRLRLPPEAKLHVLCGANLAPAWQCMSWVDGVIPFPGARADRAARAAVRRLDPGAALILPNSFGAAWDLFNLSIPRRAGRAGRMRTPLLTDTLPPLPPAEDRGARHQLSEYLELASLFGETPSVFLPAPVRTENPAAVCARLGIPADRPLLALAPGAAYGPAKQWPAEFFHAVARWWTDRGGRAVVVGSPKEAAVGEAVLEGLAGCVNAAGKTTIPEMMALLRGCRALVSNDSGAMHLAAAAGVDGVALFGSTDPGATGPLGGRWVVLNDQADCSPCFQRNCRFTGGECRCLRVIPPERVCSALEWLLGAAVAGDDFSTQKNATNQTENTTT